MSPASTVYCPSPAEIRRACSGIQRKWSPEERHRRAQGVVDDLTIPLTELGILTEELMYEVANV